MFKDYIFYIIKLKPKFYPSNFVLNFFTLALNQYSLYLSRRHQFTSLVKTIGAFVWARKITYLIAYSNTNYLRKMVFKVNLQQFRKSVGEIC